MFFIPCHINIKFTKISRLEEKRVQTIIHPTNPPIYTTPTVGGLSKPSLPYGQKPSHFGPVVPPGGDQEEMTSQPLHPLFSCVSLSPTPRKQDSCSAPQLLSVNYDSEKSLKVV